MKTHIYANERQISRNVFCWPTVVPPSSESIHLLALIMGTLMPFSTSTVLYCCFWCFYLIPFWLLDSPLQAFSGLGGLTALTKVAQVWAMLNRYFALKCFPILMTDYFISGSEAECLQNAKTLSLSSFNKESLSHSWQISFLWAFRMLSYPSSRSAKYFIFPASSPALRFLSTLTTQVRHSARSLGFKD